MKKNEEKDQEVIVIENPEVINDNYVGEIISIHKGYVFINKVKRAYESIGTNGDVFCPVPENAGFIVGQLVQFSELNPDHERVGKFRTEKIQLVENKLDVNTPEGRMTAIAKLSKAESPYHQLKKIIEEEDIEKAKTNKPLVEFIQQIAWLLGSNASYDSQHINRLAEEFVEKTFSMLSPLGVKCSIMDDVDKDAEKELIEETVVLYSENGLAGQAESLKNEYSLFLSVRDAFTLMHKNNLLTYSSVIHTKHLPELTYAFPVWFVNSKKNLADRTEENDPHPDDFIKFVSDAVDSTEYAWFYQMYNRRTRPLSHFKGKDIMPPNLVRIMKKAKEIFDYVAIMTPYHDVASKEWSDPNWLRNIDPIMVGFLEGLPHMFVLGRWSGTGVFPMLLDCIADTSNHIKINKNLLSNFRWNSYWYKGLDEGQGYLANNVDSQDLVKYANLLLKAYENGVLFLFLRGELSEDVEYKFPQ